MRTFPKLDEYTNEDARQKRNNKRIASLSFEQLAEIEADGQTIRFYENYCKDFSEINIREAYNCFWILGIHN